MMVASQADGGNAVVKFSMNLPHGYRRDEVLRFHARDAEALAERVEGHRISKGVTVEGVPVRVEITLEESRAACRADADELLSRSGKAAIEGIAKSMLGLWIDPSEFERSVRRDVLLGKVVKRQIGLRIPQTATVFEAIAWAVMGQQISVQFALTLRRSFIELGAKRHSSGLWCHPDAKATLKISADDLGKRKFSRAKAETILRV